MPCSVAAFLTAGLSRGVRGDALVAPGDVLVELAPLALRALQHQPGQGVHLVAGVFEHIGQNGLQCGRALGKDQAELGQQATQAVDASGALGLEALAQAVHAQHALLLDALDRNEEHLRPSGGFTNGRGVVGVVLAAAALPAVGADQLRGDDACVQAQGHELARPVVRARAGLHGNDAAGGQLRAPGDELVAWQGARGDHMAGAIDGMHLDHALGQIDPDANGFTSNDSSCNLLHGTSPFNGFRLMTSNTTNLGASTPLPEGGKSLRIPYMDSPANASMRSARRPCSRRRLVWPPHAHR